MITSKFRKQFSNDLEVKFLKEFYDQYVSDSEINKKNFEFLLLSSKKDINTIFVFTKEMYFYVYDIETGTISDKNEYTLKDLFVDYEVKYLSHFHSNDFSAVIDEIQKFRNIEKEINTSEIKI